MKKNITINLFGSLYCIDEDAYELLKKYEENMRSYFMRQEGGEEIADDIEHRVAELFNEMKTNGVEAVTIEHVEDIIRRIGNPEDLEEESVEASQETVAETEAMGIKKRKLFRGSDDVLLGGVMSGLSCYFGGADPLPWRIGMVLLTVFSSGFFAIAYLVLWAFLPQARTPEDRLRMQGKIVTPENLSEEIMNGMHKAGEYIANPTVQRKARGCFSTLINLLVWCFKGVLILAGCMVALMGVAVLISLAFGLIGLIHGGIQGLSTMQEMGFWQHGFVESASSVPGVVWKSSVLIVSLIVGVGLLLYGCFHSVGHLLGAVKPLSLRVRFTLVIIWLISVAVSVTLFILLAVQLDHADDIRRRKDNTHDGFYIMNDGWNYLQSGGWKVITFDNCSKDILSYDSHYMSKHKPYLYIRDSYENGRNGMRCRLQREVEKTPGYYRLEGILGADGAGACLYAYDTESRSLMLKEVPQNGRRGGNLSAMTPGEQEALPIFHHVTDTTCWNTMRERFEGWNYVVVDSIRHTGGHLQYGVSNDVLFTQQSWTGRWFSVADVVLTRIGDLESVSLKKK